MNIRSFVGTSSAVLLAWLGATYLHKLSPERYPNQDRGSNSASIEETADEAIAKISSTPR